MSTIEPTSAVIEKIKAVQTGTEQSYKDIYIQKETEVSANVKEIVWQTNIATLESEIASLEADIASFQNGITSYRAQIAEKQAIIATIQPIVEEAFAKIPKAEETPEEELPINP